MLAAMWALAAWVLSAMDERLRSLKEELREKHDKHET